MASETEVPEMSSSSERHRNLSLFLPFILGFTTTATTISTAATTSQRENPDQETLQTSTPHERIILLNPSTRRMVVTASLDSLLRDLARKNPHPPASKASIEAMPSGEVAEIEDKNGECVICLEEWKLGGVIKEMPCKHIFHANCIEKWLEIHGSCPVCRYQMPVDEVDLGKKRFHEQEEEEEGRDGRRFGREIWVSFSFSSNNRRNEDLSQTPSTQSNDLSSSNPTIDEEMDC